MREKPVTVTGYELDELRMLIEQRSGILFDASRERFFSTRVREFIAHKNLHGGTDLLRLLSVSNVEYDAMLEGLLTQETSFLRYPSVFEALGKRIIPELQEKKFWDNPRTLRIWSAACSTGEEPYSIAITVADALPFSEAWRIEILATDISRRALQHAERGVYTGRSLDNLTPHQVDNYFTKTRHGYVVKPRIRRMVSFAPMNLTQAIYVGRMDCIFCMNVLMYFSEERRDSVIQRFHECLEPGGYFLLGHAESLNNSSIRLESLVVGDCRIYRKPAKERALRQAVVAEGSL
ncbi:MAG: protein-glutamate O-methyltransferase CheR [Candidatus Acidiferrales bacterium]